MIVVDASAVVETLLGSDKAERAAFRLYDPTQSLHAPHLLDVEVTHALRRLAALEEIDAERGATMLALLGAMSIRRYPHRNLLPRAWDLRADITAYDAMYVALAETLDAPLLTRDRRLAAAADHLIDIELV